MNLQRIGRRTLTITSDGVGVSSLRLTTKSGSLLIIEINISLLHFFSYVMHRQVELVSLKLLLVLSIARAGISWTA